MCITQVDNSQATHILTCECNHLTFFGGDFVVAPNTINFDTVFGKFSRIGDNLSVLLTIASLLVFYWLVLFFLRRLDKRDVEKVRALFIIYIGYFHNQLLCSRLLIE